MLNPKNNLFYICVLVSMCHLYHIIYYIIKIGFKRHGCAKWFHQIANLFLDF